MKMNTEVTLYSNDGKVLNTWITPNPVYFSNGCWVFSDSDSNPVHISGGIVVTRKVAQESTISGWETDFIK